MDRQVLVAAHQHGFPTTDLVELAFFPPRHGARSSASSKAYERLRELWLWGYLDLAELVTAQLGQPSGSSGGAQTGAASPAPDRAPL